jgi:hypothetical protein
VKFFPAVLHQEHLYVAELVLAKIGQGLVLRVMYSFRVGQRLQAGQHAADRSVAGAAASG